MKYSLLARMILSLGLSKEGRLIGSVIFLAHDGNKVSLVNVMDTEGN